MPRQRLIHSPCVKLPQVKDPTAAGDSFVAAFCTAVCAGLDAREALVFANHTAALTVSRMGAQPSLPRIGEVLELMHSRGAGESALGWLTKILKSGEE